MPSLRPSRRALLSASLLQAARPAQRTALCLNEDPNHFYAARAGQRIDRALCQAWVDQYAGTQVRELLICTNAMRTAFPSKVWTPFWHGYDPKGPDDQELFASLDPATQKAFRRWVHAAWRMQQDGLDHIAIWLARARQKGLSPWLSMRMNDLHNVEDERHPLHSEFWKQHPEYRRLAYRGEMRDKAFDYLHPAVRDYHFALIDDLASRYDFDGIELDWMRHGYHFAPGREAEGRVVLNEFMARVRRRLGRKKRIGVRVPSTPVTAYRLGMDAVTWAQAGHADLVVPTNFWRTVDTGMPIALWRQMLPASCLLGAGLELGLNVHPTSKATGGRPFQTNSLETVRGAAAAYLEQGADRIYLFNYMDQDTAIEDLSEYPPLLRECGALATLTGKPRRHVVTYQDTWAPGEARSAQLPVETAPGRWASFRLLTGPADTSLRPELRLGVTADPRDWEIRVNGLRATYVGPAQWKPGPDVAGYAWALPSLTSTGAVVDLRATSAGVIHWVEVAWRRK